MKSLLPAEATSWERLQPHYRALLERRLHCGGCLEQLLLDRSDLDAVANEAHTDLHIQMTCHTDDPQRTKAYLAFVSDVVPRLKEVGFELDRAIVGSPHAAALPRPRHEVLLRNLTADVEIFRPESIPLQTQDTKLDQRFDEISGAMTVHFEGAERTLPQMSRYLEETDRDRREAAWRATWERRAADRDTLHDVYEEMIGLRHQVARNAGFDGYAGYVFKARHRFDYSPAHCRAFHDSVEKLCVPLVRKLHARRAAALGAAPLRPWDLAVDIHGRPPLRPFQGADDLVERTARLFARMDGRLAEVFESLRAGGCLDLESRKGKAPGGYQAYRDHSRKPFIFMNAVGVHGDLETMVHEAGHAFHSTLCENERLLDYRHAPLEFAEVASMSMELCALPFLDEFYAPAEADRARRDQLERIITLMPWIATIDAFQHWIYEHPGHTRSERTDFWLSLTRRFGADVSWEGLEPFREISWQRQGHLFGVPFYYIEYGIAQLGALQLWSAFRRDPAAAIEAYKRALSLGGSRPLPQLFAAAGLKFDLSAATMKRLVEDVQRELARLPD